MSTDATLTKADFQSDQETRWCPGCGDYAILSAVQEFMPELGIPPERIVFITGIGCAGRFAYYMDTYGMHGDPRPRAGAGHRAGHRARRPVDLGRHRRRRRAVDRRQPPDPRAAAQRAGEDPAVQQPDLRPDQGPGLADLRARQDHQVDAVRRRRPPVQPGRAGARRRRDVRRADDRPRPRTPDRGAARGGRAPGRGARRDLPELPGVQRRRVLRADRQGARGCQPDPPAGRRADPLRRPTASAGSSAAPTAAWGSSTSPTWARRRCSSTTRRAPTRPRLRAGPARRTPPGPTPIGIFRDVERPVYASAAPARAGERGRARGPAARRRDLDGRLAPHGDASARRARRRASGLGDVPSVGLDREPGGVPLQQAADDVVRVIARRANASVAIAERPPLRQ